MLNMVKSNILTNIKFYRRNRLLVGGSLFILAVMAVSTLPGIFYFSKTKHLDIIRMLFSTLSSFTTIVIGGLGLLFISHHLRNRTTKMVFTKPCSPELWLLSGLLSAGLVAAVSYVLIFIICSALFLYWGLPFQWGLVVITFDQLIQSMIALSFAVFLAVLFHPVIAVLIIVLFNESSFYYLKLLLMSGIKSGGSSEGLLRLLKGLVDAVYMVMPTFQPFSEKLHSVYSSFRITPGHINYVLLVFAYGLISCSFYYLLSLYFLKGKRHV